MRAPGPKEARDDGGLTAAVPRRSTPPVEPGPRRCPRPVPPPLTLTVEGEASRPAMPSPALRRNGPPAPWTKLPATTGCRALPSPRHGIGSLKQVSKNKPM